MLPTPKSIYARAVMGRTACHTAEKVDLPHAMRLHERERGLRTMEPALCEFFLFKCGMHRLYGGRQGDLAIRGSSGRNG